MTRPLVVPLDVDDPLAPGLAMALSGELASAEIRRFPDRETYLRYGSSPQGREVVLLCTLDRPDPKALPLMFAAETARELGAAGVGLVAPYLAYMRQDRRFREGEAVTSLLFAGFVSRCVDWLVTVDPHLHRHASLAALYGIPAVAAHAAPLLSAWIAREVPSPLVVGPDEESEQWAAEVARAAGAPHTVLRKVRRGDRDVEVTPPDPALLEGRTPVLVDDIVSTARTMIETVGHLRAAGAAAPVCMAVHGVFAEGAHDALLGAGAARVLTTNTIPHASNAIDVTALLGAAVVDLLLQRGRQH
ncbi:phosphoribosylpyrophosphate synthetase [Falsiroseomonas bella]|uniref:Phosphoribosylpyrophosphate synthetase n=1 Tax=Falsiroseomonas bella TaxID=2184016 RepID=A0A317F8U2_9PROT|nr:ribose-phosphate pyrophosphokinase [Falsiroseomonas bella]PWS34369.1 phosphoribosylpyrophosphate synthetase [Falsiroseomonas bella]